VLAVSECLARELREACSPIKVSVVFSGAVATQIATGLPLGDGGPVQTLNCMLKELTDAGMTPERLVDLVLRGVAEERFAIFPHEEVRESARKRLDALLEGRLPA
jgi:hypothetical protein